MRLRYYPPSEPTEQALRRIRRSQKIVDIPVRTFWRMFHTQHTWSTAPGVEGHGPCLVVANHANRLDPAMTMLSLRSPVQYLATESVFYQPGDGRVAQHFGSVPKRKFVPDTQAIRRLRAWAALGANPGVFPEGERSWDGELRDFLPGIDKLIFLLGLPVITMRVHNGHRVWPRWAKKARRGRVHVEIDAPIQYDRKQPAAEILADLRRRITPDPDFTRDWQVTSTRFAEGIETALMICPACHAAETLISAGCELQCSACRQKWTVDSWHQLRPQGVGRELGLAEACRANRDFLRQEIRPSSQSADQALAELRGRPWHDITQPDQVKSDTGVVRLLEDRVQFQGTRPFELPMSDVLAASVELGGLLVIRTRERSFAVETPENLVLLWETLVAQCLARRDTN